MDLKSTNGLFINDCPLKPYTTYCLKNSDKIIFGPIDQSYFIYEFINDYKDTDSNADVNSFYNRIQLNQFDLSEPKSNLPDNEFSVPSKSSETIRCFYNNHDSSKNTNKQKSDNIRSVVKLPNSRNVINRSKSYLKYETYLKEKIANERRRLERQKERFKRRNVDLDKKDKEIRKKFEEIKIMRKQLSIERENLKRTRKDFAEIDSKKKIEAKKYIEGDKEEKETINKLNGIEPQKHLETILDSELKCTICHELFFQAIILNCSHSFCLACIEQWKQTNNKNKVCPICRVEIKYHNRQLVLDNLIDYIVRNFNVENREMLIEERNKKQIIEQKNCTCRDFGSRVQKSREATSQYSDDDDASIISITLDYDSYDSYTS